MHVHHSAEVQDDLLAPAARKRARIVLSIIVLPLLIATIVGIVALHPGSNSRIGSLPQIAKGMDQARVRVVNQPLSSCQLSGTAAVGSNTVEQQLAQQNEQSQQATGAPNDAAGASLLGSAVCARVLSGQGAGMTVPAHVPPEFKSSIHAGTVIKVLYDPSQVSQGTPYMFWDVERSMPLALLGILYVVLVIAVAGKRGFAALIGLLASTVVLCGFIIPALMSGSSPLLVTLVGSAAMLFVSVYIAHGVTIRTTTALLGTLVGLGITVMLATWGVHASTLSGATNEDALTLYSYFPHMSMSALLISGMVIAGLGALNDVTITQASAVWELQAANPEMGRWRLFSRAMRIGADHIASTVYTLAFAYAGTALPTLMLAMMVRRPIGSLLVAGDIAEEVVRTLVASIGLILAIPITTALGTILVSAIGVDEERPAWHHRLRRKPLAPDDNMWEVPVDAEQ